VNWRDISERVVRRSIFAVADDVVFVSGVMRVRYVLIRKISDVYFRAVNTFKAREFRYVFA
jgi:hypothetical protein